MLSTTPRMSKCKSCSVIDNYNKFKSVSENFFQCGRLFNDEELLDFTPEGMPPRTMYFICEKCHLKYNLFGKYKESLPDSIICCFCKVHAKNSKWIINFHSRKWCHKDCLLKNISKLI